jgi:hypothetical protein
MFLGLSVLFAISLPFQDDVPLRAWPFAFGYCALLPACVIGIARLGRSAFLILGALASVPLVLGAIGVALMFQTGSRLEGGMVWLQASLYLFYAVGAVAFWFTVKGWILYWRQTHEAG